MALFSAFFWTLAGIILLMLIFEEDLIALEDKLDAKAKQRKNQKGNRR